MKLTLDWKGALLIVGILAGCVILATARLWAGYLP